MVSSMHNIVSPICMSALGQRFTCRILSITALPALSDCICKANFCKCLTVGWADWAVCLSGRGPLT